MARHFITRITTAQRNAATAAEGEFVYDTTDGNYYRGTTAAGPGNWAVIQAAPLATVSIYDAATTYAINAIVRDTTGELYVSEVANNVGNPLTKHLSLIHI